MVHQNVCRRGVQAPIPHKRVEDGSADRAILSCGAGGRPEFFEGFSRFGWAASRHAVGESDRVHRTGTRTADRLDVKPLVFEELVEHAPGKGAVGAAALQRELDRLLMLPIHLTSPKSWLIVVPRRGVAAYRSILLCRALECPEFLRRGRRE